MRLTLVIHSLSAGGAEKIMTILANYWAERNWDITLLTFDSDPSFYYLDDRVKHIPLAIASSSENIFTAIYENLIRIQVLRSAISKSRPDAVISFLSTVNILTIIATRGLKTPVIVEEHNYPDMCPLGRIWEILRMWTYPRADKVIALTARALGCLSPQIQARGYVLPNPVLPIIFKENCQIQWIVKPSLIAMGRLDEQKHFDLLLQAFSTLKDNHPEWTLTILGEGKLRAQLEDLRDHLGLKDRVYLPGVVKNPHDFLRQADIFVMSSRFEGFPNAICEAMACGLPVISTDCPSGPREIIREGVDGNLVPTEDVLALSNAMQNLMLNESLRNHLAQNALEITDRFGLERIMAMWDKILQEVAHRY